MGRLPPDLDAEAQYALRRRHDPQIGRLGHDRGQPHVAGGRRARPRDFVEGAHHPRQVATIAPDGTFAIQVTPGKDGLARSFWARFSPPSLPPMPEAEALKAVPLYAGLVPKEGQVEVVAGANRIDVELVPAPRR